MTSMPIAPERFALQNQAWTRVKTPIPGLYLTGSDVYTMGIVGAMMGALLTTSQLPDGVSIPQGFAAAKESWRNRDRQPLPITTAITHSTRTGGL